MTSYSYKLIYLILASLLVFGCEGGTTIIKKIDNQSSESLTLILTSTVLGRDKPMQIKAKESKQIFWYDQQRIFYIDESYECTRMIDTIEMSINNNKTLTKDIMNPDNWIHQRKEGRNAKEICTFRITNQDLEH